ncbi:MAG: hypothetical protein DRJ35_02460 [Thermoprotei archaeon]|nr:MAG: hypothetical protein DRJ35_02460 [Thermoprotei archaeon]
MEAGLGNYQLQEGEILLEFYEVEPPFAYVMIVKTPIGKIEYRVVEPPLTKDDIEKLAQIKSLLLEVSKIDLSELLEREPQVVLEKEIRRIIDRYKIRITGEAFDKFLYYIRRDTLGYGKIDVLMKDPNIEDISCDGVNVPIYVWHRKFESIPTNIFFDDPEELESLLIKMSYRAGKQISIAQPIVEGSLPGGFRIHLTLEEVSRKGGTFTIRKFREVPYSVVDLIKLGTISPRLAAYFWYIIEKGKSLMIVGATASGKTTALNALATFIRPEAKIITIEDTPELNLPHENWVPLITRPSYEEWVRNVDLYELLRSAMRMRPDYVIIGEIRGKEAFALFQAIATGHAGLCTMHAENVEYALKRLMADPMNIPLFLISVMNVYALIKRLKIGDRVVRRIVAVEEAVGVDVERGVPITRRIFRYNPSMDTIEETNDSILLKTIADEQFISYEEVIEEINRRERVIKFLVDKGITSYIHISKITRDYYYDPERVYRSILAGTYAV